MRLWDRKLELNLGGTLVRDLRVQFAVKASLKADANTAEILCWNLSTSTRAKLQKEKIPVSLEAGYAEEIALLFKGDMRKPTSVREGVDVVTTFEAGDGENAMRSGRINESFKPGIAVGDVLTKLAKTLDVNVDDALKKLKDGTLRNKLTSFANGVTLSGNSWRELQRLLLGSGLEASVQNGILQVLEVGQPTKDQAVVLRADTGMIGSPEPGDKGIIKVKSLLQPTVWPGRKIQVQSQQEKPGKYALDGFYRVESVIHAGVNIGGQDWYSTMEARPL